MPNSLGGIKSAHDRHREVQDDDVGAEFQNLLKRFRAVPGLAANFPLIPIRQQDAHTHPNNFMIVRNQKTHRNLPELQGYRNQSSSSIK